MQPGTTGLRYIQAQYTDIPCAIEGGVAMPTTGHMRTGKAFASAFPEMQADVAHLRRVRWGNEMHHDTSTLSLIGDEGAELIEPFRRADWIDVSLGVLTFGLPRERLREIFARWPNAGFHKRLVQLTLRQARAHPLRPLPVLKW